MAKVKEKRKNKTPARGGKSVVKSKGKRGQVSACGKKKPVRTARKCAVKKPEKKSIFEGATEISVTENKIAVTRSASKSTNGKYSEKTTRVYHDKTPANMRAVGNLMNQSGVKKITVKLK